MRKKITVTRSYSVDIPDDKVSDTLGELQKFLGFDVTPDMLFMHVAKNSGSNFIDGIGNLSSFGITSEMFCSSVTVIRKGKKHI